MLLAQMVVEYIADTSKLMNSMGEMKNAAASGATAVAGTILAVGTALAVAGGMAAKAAGDFQAGITKLETAGGELHSNLAMVGDGIKKIALDTGTGTKDLLSAMVMIDSANQHGADSLKVLTAAAQGAKTDNADLTTTTMALTGVMTNFKIPASGATGAMNELIAAAKDGKMHLQDLSTALGPIGMVAVNAGIAFADVGGAIALMTNKNVSAQQASQNLAFAIRSLDAPSGVATKSLASVGLKAQEVADTLRNQGLPAALQLIEDHVGNKFPQSSVEWTTAMKNIMGGKAGLNVALALGGDNLKAYENNVNDISGALKKGGTSVDGWTQVQGNFNTQIQRAQEMVEIAAINIGTALLPAVQSLVPVLGNVVTAGSNMVAFFQHNQTAMDILKIAAITLAAAIGITLVAALVVGAIAAAAFVAPFFLVAAPFILIGTLIAALAATIYILYQRFQPVRTVVDDVGKAFVHVWGILVSSFMPAWNQLVAAFQQALPAFTVVGQILLGVLVVAIGIVIAVVIALATGIAASVGGIVQIFTGLVQILSGVFNVIGGIFIFLMDLITGRWSKLGSDLQMIGMGIVNIFVGLWNVIAGIFNAAAGLIGGILVGFIRGVIAFFSGLYDTLVGHSIVPDMVNGIVTWFEQLPGRVGAAIQSMITNVLNLLNGLVSSALQVGSNIVNNIAQGIRNAIGAVGNAISTVTQFISDHLPHSPAKMGPLMDLQNQGMEISNQVAKGMVNGVPLITSAMNNLAKPVTVGLKGVASASGVSPLQGGGQGDTYVQITMDGQDITNRVMKRVVKDLRGFGLKK